MRAQLINYETSTAQLQTQITEVQLTRENGEKGRNLRIEETARKLKK